MGSATSDSRGFLHRFVTDFADGLRGADARRPAAVNQRSGLPFQPGIGPHSEAATIKLVLAELAAMRPDRYSRAEIDVRYPGDARRRCDVVIHDGSSPWFIEVKLLRILGDNGRPNDNMLMHILSPYPHHRSALTNCEKLAKSGFVGNKAILIYGFDYDEWPAESAIAAFEARGRTCSPW